MEVILSNNIKNIKIIYFGSASQWYLRIRKVFFYSFSINSDSPFFCRKVSGSFTFLLAFAYFKLKVIMQGSSYLVLCWFIFCNIFQLNPLVDKNAFILFWVFLGPDAFSYLFYFSIIDMFLFLTFYPSQDFLFIDFKFWPRV